jgi:hypothetical protein
MQWLLQENKAVLKRKKCMNDSTTVQHSISLQDSVHLSVCMCVSQNMFLGDAPRTSVIQLWGRGRGERGGGRDTWGPESRMMGPKENVEHREGNPKTGLVLEVPCQRNRGIAALPSDVVNRREIIL